MQLVVVWDQLRLGLVASTLLVLLIETVDEQHRFILDLPLALLPDLLHLPELQGLTSALCSVSIVVEYCN